MRRLKNTQRVKELCDQMMTLCIDHEQQETIILLHSLDLLGCFSRYLKILIYSKIIALLIIILFVMRINFIIYLFMDIANNCDVSFYKIFYSEIYVYVTRLLSTEKLFYLWYLRFVINKIQCIVNLDDFQWTVMSF